MKLTIPVTPVSINKAFRGMHFTSKTFKKYEEDCFLLLPEFTGKLIPGELFIHYTFYIKNYGNSDTGNFEKMITDILVKRGYLKDDRYVKAFYLEKVRVKDIYQEKIIANIVPYEDRWKALNVIQK